MAAPVVGPSDVPSQDQTAHVPITVAQSELFGQTTLSAIFASARSPAVTNAAMAEITAALSRIQELPAGTPPDFTEASQSQVLGAHLNAVTSVWADLIALGFSLLVGIGAGVYPTARAARLTPIQALHHE